MASFGVYLDSVSLPIVTRVLTGLGFGVVTYAGLQAAFNSMQGYVVNSLNTLTGTAAALFYLAGFPTAIGLVLAAASMRVSMISVKKLQLM